jgi:CRISPR/Cas system-associated endonuclease/helicase Cas3
MAPLDNIVQVMGRLNRECKNKDAILTIFKTNENAPYSSLEFKESMSMIEDIKNSADLYRILPEYYANITNKNLTNKNRKENIEKCMIEMDFEHVWKIIRKHASLNDKRKSIIIPDENVDFEQMKKDLQFKKQKNIYRLYGKMIASIPYNVQEKIQDKIDNESNIKKIGIEIPKKELLTDLYDKDVGLDKWLKK